MALSSDFQKLDVHGLTTLYELDARNWGAGVFRFHSHLAFKDWEIIYKTVDTTSITVDTTLISAEKLFGIGNQKVWRRNIIWQGQVYEPMQIDASGLEKSTDGKASMPTLSMANNINGVQSAVSALCRRFGDFADSKLTIVTTLAKYLDAENFSAGNPDAQNQAEKELWYIEQKTSADLDVVTFELSNPVDFGDRKSPNRQITSQCHWCIMGNYRSDECGYIGTAMFTDKNVPTDDPNLDVCSGTLNACKLRFGDNPLSFGGFPGASLV